MKTSRFFPYAASLALTTILAACASDQEPADERIVVIPEEKSFELVFPISGTDENKSENKQEFELVPGKVYLGSDLDGVFKLKEIQSVVNEDGRLAATVRGSTEPYSFWTWLWNGEKERRIGYRFIWFDKDGNVISTILTSVPDTRLCLPGDPVRFSGLAKDEKIAQHSIVINVLDNKELEEIQEAQSLKGAALDKLDPAKDEPLKEVKIEK